MIQSTVHSTRRHLATRLIAALLILTCAHAVAQAQQKFTLKGDQWQKQKTYPPGSPQFELQNMREKLAKGHPDQAESMAKAWLNNHPGSASAFRAQARLIVGDAKVAQHYYYDALYNYEALIRGYPQSKVYDTALRREYQIARLFVHGMKRLFLGMRILPAEGEGAELLIRIQERAPGSLIGERASMELANYYYREDEMANAAEAYDMFMKNYPNSPRREWAMLRLIHASLARFKGAGFDPTGLLDAQQRLKTFEKEYPAAADRIGADALLVRIRESLAMNDYQTAAWFQGQGKDVSAVVLFRRLIKQYPQTAAAKKAIAQLKQMHAAVVANTDTAANGGKASASHAAKPARKKGNP